MLPMATTNLPSHMEADVLEVDSWIGKKELIDENTLGH